MAKKNESVKDVKPTIKTVAVRISEQSNEQLERVCACLRMSKKVLVDKSILKLVANYDFIDQESGGYDNLSEVMKEEVKNNIFNPTWLKDEYF